MVFVIGFTDAKDEKKLDKDAPIYYINHGLTGDLFFNAVPKTGEVFYNKDAPSANDGHPHQELKHDDPRLMLVKESLDQYLDGYTPRPDDRDTMSYAQGLLFEGHREGEVRRTSYQRERGKEPQESVTTLPLSHLVQEMEGKLKYAAHTLREVVNYSMQNQRNIQVN